jgi:hypothetical protein
MLSDDATLAEDFAVCDSVNEVIHGRHPWTCLPAGSAGCLLPGTNLLFEETASSSYYSCLIYPTKLLCVDLDSDVVR